MDTLNIINNYNAEDYITASLINQLNEGETKDRNVDERDRNIPDICKSNERRWDWGPI